MKKVKKILVVLVMEVEVEVEEVLVMMVQQEVEQVELFSTEEEAEEVIRVASWQVVLAEGEVVALRKKKKKLVCWF